MITAAIFDLDDTLYPEADFVRSGFAAVGNWCEKELHLGAFAETAWGLFCAGRRGDVFDAALAKLKNPVDKHVIGKMVNVYRTHTPQIGLPGDSIRCIQQLHRVCMLGLITDGPSGMQWNKIRALGLEKWFDLIIVTSDLGDGYSKPHERAFIETEKHFNATGPALMYVADNPAKDFIVPMQRGWRTVRIARREGLHSLIEMAPPPQLWLADLQDVAAKIGL